MVQTETRPKSKTGKRTQPPCLLCKSPDTYVARVGVREDSSTPVFGCNRCKLRFIEPDFDDVRDYYRTEYRKTHDFKPGQVLTPDERFREVRPLVSTRETAKRIKNLIPAGSSVLDVGCSSGYLLDAIGDKYDRFGLEWNPEDAKYVREVGELPCEETSVDECYPGKKFNAIIAMHVLEHQPDPVKFIESLKSRLIGGGYLYLEVPNLMDAMVSIYNVPAFRDFWYRKPHITYWTRETLATMLGALGFEAQVKNAQRYGLVNHINWLLGGGAMDVDAREYWRPIEDSHPVAALFNRNTSKLDNEYRVQITSLGAGDLIFAECRLRQI